MVPGHFNEKGHFYVHRFTENGKYMISLDFAQRGELIVLYRQDVKLLGGIPPPLEKTLYGYSMVVYLLI